MQPDFSGQTRAGDPTHYEAEIGGAHAWGWHPQHDRVEAMNAYVDWFKDGAP